MTNMREQTFGVEIEMTGITRSRAAKTIAAYFGTEATTEAGTMPTMQKTAREEFGRP